MTPAEAGPRELSHYVIPAPAQFDSTGGGFALRPGTPIEYTAPAVASLVERFCSDVARRTGLRLAPLAGTAGPGEPAVRIELVAGGELGVLPAPLGISPAAGGPPDERHWLAIDAGEAVLRAVEPAGVARGLTTLVQLLATAPDSRAGDVCLPGARILDAPRYAWRGLSIDLARAFFTLDEVRRVIDLLALYKLNVLHVHLTDERAGACRSVGRARVLRPAPPATAPTTSARSPPTPRTASSPSSPRSTRPGTRPRSWTCARS